MRPEDKVFINSDKTFADIVLKTQDWMGGDKPTQLDLDVYDLFQATT
jgi:hypothetical protein